MPLRHDSRGQGGRPTLHTPVAALRGRALLPRADAPTVDALEDALIEIDRSGRIISVSKAPADCDVPPSHPGCALLPGFVDTHIHFPQTRVIGSASGPLLDWLRRTTFPEEARFADRAYAEVVADEFCAALVAQGTTAAAIYSSSHPGATDALFAALDRWGLRAMAGLTLMDQGAPDDVLLAVGPAMAAAEDLVARWHGHDDGRLRFCVTPRFALSCSSEMMRAAAGLGARHGLPMQTHLSENTAEMAAVAAMFPGSKDYLAVYEDHGLAGERALFAHCIWLSSGEWDRMAAQGSAVSHCPDSNFFLGSGVMPIRHATSRGVRVGLGTDVGGGRSFSIRRVAASAYDAGLLAGERVPPDELLWRATAGGAEAMGLAGVAGRLAEGFDADVVAVPVPDEAVGDALLDALLFRHDAGPVAATYVRGRRLGP